MDLVHTSNNDSDNNDNDDDNDDVDANTLEKRSSNPRARVSNTTIVRSSERDQLFRNFRLRTPAKSNARSRIITILTLTNKSHEIHEHTPNRFALKRPFEAYTMRHTPARPRHARAMLAVTYVSVFVVALWIPFVVAETSKRCEVPVGVDASLLRFVSEVDVGLAALLLFNAINVLICLWEIALWRHRDLVIKRNRGYVKKFGDRVRVLASSRRSSGRDASKEGRKEGD